MATNSLVFDFIGRDRASKTFDKVGGKADGLRSKLGTFGSIVGRTLGAATVAATGFAVAGAAMGIRTAASLEQAGIAFEQLLGSAEKSQTFLSDLSSFAAATPFELPGLIDASRQLIGVGQSAESVIPTLTAWGDAAGALGVGQEDFSRVMIAVTQAMSKGKVQAEELMQITENGIPIWPILARAMGKTVPELQDLASKGELLADDVFPALEAQMKKDYGGSMERQSKTLTGLWSTFMDTLNIGLATAIIPVQDELKGGLTAAIGITEDALALLPPIMEKVAERLASLGEFITSTAVPAIRNLTETFGAEGLGGVMTQVLDWLTAAAPQILAFLLEQRQAFFEAALNVFSSLVEALPVIIPQIIDGLVGLVTMLISSLVNSLPALTEAAVMLFTGLVDAAVLVLPDVLAGMLAIIQGLLTAIVENLPLLLDAGVKMLTALLNGLIEALPMILNFIVKDLIPTILTLIIDNLPKIIQAGVDIIVALLTGLLDALPEIIRFVITDLIPAIVGAIIGNLPEILQAGIDIIKALLEGLIDVLPEIITFFAVDLPKAIIGAIDRDMLLDTGEQIMKGLAAGMVKTDPVLKASTSIATFIIRNFSGILGIESPSTVFAGFGLMIIKGLVGGIKGAVHLVSRLMTAVPQMIAAKFRNAGRLLFWAGRAIVLGLRSGIASAIGDVVATLLRLLARVNAIVAQIRFAASRAQAAAASARSAAASVSVARAGVASLGGSTFVRAGVAARGSQDVRLTVEAGPGSKSGLATAFLGLVSEGKIRLSANGVPVRVG